MVMVSSSPDTVSPTADQCEALGHAHDRQLRPLAAVHFRSANPPANGYKWTYAHAIGLEQLQDEFTAIWASLSTNKTIGALFPNDADGNAWRSGWDPVWAAKGLKMIGRWVLPRWIRRLQLPDRQVQECRMRDRDGACSSRRTS